MADPRTAASRAFRAARNAPLAASTALRRLGTDPVRTAVLLSRRAPRLLTGRARRVPSLDVLARWESGDRTGAEAAALAAARSGGAGETRRMIALATALERPDLALRLLELLPADDPARPRLSALAAWSDGDLHDAEQLARSGTAGGWEGRRTRRLARSLDAELAVLTPAWSSPADAGPGYYAGTDTYQPVRGRILHLVTNSLPWANAGYTTRTQQILRAERALGLDAQAVTRLGFPVAQGHLDAATLDVVDGVPYHRLLPVRPLPGAADALLARGVDEAAALVHELQPALLHAASNHVNGQVALALRDRFDVPVVYEVRGFLEESWLSRRPGASADGERSDRYQMARALETYVMQEADLVTTLGEVMRTEIIARGVDPERVLVAPNAVDARFLAPVPPAQVAALRADLGIGRDDVTVGVVSTLYAHEGIATLVRAVAELVERGAPVRLVIVGDGPERKALQHLVDDLGLTGRTVVTGRVPFEDVHRYYALLDVFAVPRLDARVSHLVTPLKPVEAMAAGRPVVGSDVGGLREVITDGVTGLLVPPDDPLALAGAIEPLLYDPAERERIGEAARAWVAEHRTWEQVAAGYRTAYALLGAV